MKRSPAIIAVIVSTAVFCLQTVFFATPASAATTPAEGVSLYIDDYSTSHLETFGCQLGTRDRNLGGTQTPVVALQFGGMVKEASGEYRALGYLAGDLTTAQVLSLAENYATGYYTCTGSDSGSTAEVALTVNNDGNLDTQAGKVWAQVVNQFAAWLGGHPAGSQVTATGGYDAEPGFASVAGSRRWADGYASLATKPLLDVGSADGCPRSGPLSTTMGCNGDWAVNDIWYLSWGIAPGLPMPEIYTTNGAQAQQWYVIARWGVVYKGLLMGFHGSTTQQHACQWRSCTGTNNSVSAGYNQLYNALHQSSTTAQTPPYTTDFEWASDRWSHGS
jgi:hypothetical protein